MRSKSKTEHAGCDVAFSQQAMLAVLNAIEVPIVAVNEQGLVLFSNSAATEFLGEIANIHETLGKFVGLSDGSNVTQFMADAIRTKSSRVLHGVLLKGGSQPADHKYISIQISPVDGSFPQCRDACVLVFHSRELEGGPPSPDITERLAQLGGLTAKIAHELNNPLDGILRYVNLALRLLGDGDDPRLRNYLSESRTGLMRMVQIIGELLQYSRRTEGAFDESDVNEIVEQAIRNISPAAEQNGIVVAADFQTRNMPVARGSRLYQVCCNLLKNAVEAMPGGGRLTITCGVVQEEVVIRVADTGVGLPADAGRLFEPFFTTKSAGKGTGLGLAICKDFIEEMKGSIVASSGEEGGAVFSVQIPLSSFHKRTSFHSGNRLDP